MGAIIEPAAFQVRGFTLYRTEAPEGPTYGMHRHAPEGGVAAALPDGLRIVFDQRGQPSVQAKLGEACSVQGAVLLK